MNKYKYTIIEDDGSYIVIDLITLAEAILPIFEAQSPGDNRPRKAIEAAKDESANARAAAADAEAVRVAYAARAADATTWAAYGDNAAYAATLADS